MSTQGLFIPLSVIKGDTLDVAFDVSIDGQSIDPSDISLEGQFTSGSDDTFPEAFTFLLSESDAYKMHATISSDITQELEVGEYVYQIRFEHLSNLSDDVDSTGTKTTILYGSLTVLFSPLFD